MRQQSIFLLLFLLGSSYAHGQEISGPGFDPTPVRISHVEKTSRRPITSMDLLAIRDLKGLSISPDGKYVAFIVGEAVLDSNSYRSGMFLMGTAPESAVVSLGTAGLPHFDSIHQWVPEVPQWSPDSQYVTYRARMDSKATWQVWHWSVKGKKPVQMTNVPGDLQNYSWSTDGTKLVLSIKRARGPDEIKKLEENGIVYDASFGMDDNRGILSQVLDTMPVETETWIHEIATSVERRATETETTSLGPWASDLDEKVFTGKIGDSLQGHHIIDAKVSPDKRMVAYRYLAEDPAQFNGSVYVLFVKAVRGGTPVPLTTGIFYVRDYWWKEDSQTIYHLDDQGKGYPPILRASTVSGGTPVPVFKDADYISLCSVDQDSRYVACGQENAISPQQIMLLDLSTGKIRTLIDLNPEFQNIQLDKPVRIDGVNRFGDAWFAHLIKPLNYEPGKRYPTILTTYRSGEYFLRGASGDESPIQVYAAHGFAVLSFDEGQARVPRAGNFQDCLSAYGSSPTASMEMAIQEGVRMGIVDPERVGVTGYSAGSEYVAYAITHTKLFRAASGAAGDNSPSVYYMASKPIQEGSFANCGLGGWPEGKAKAHWEEIDPAFNAEHIDAPVLNNDPDSEALGDLALYTSLKELGKPVELIVYPNELHHVNQPKHRYQMYRRNLDWFRFWLKDEQDPDPAKADQYKRWRELRALHQESTSTVAPQ